MSQFRDEATLHPSEGARFLFERASVSPDSRVAAYRVAVFTPDRRFDYRADMQLDGSFELSEAGAPAPADLAKKLSAISKLIARAAKKKLANELPPWPSRVLRWRGPGR